MQAWRARSWSSAVRRDGVALKLLAMASDVLKGEAQSRVDQTLVQSFSDLSAGRAAFGRLQKQVKPRKDRNKLHAFLPKGVLIGPR